jgi:hypothetical protein
MLGRKRDDDDPFAALRGGDAGLGVAPAPRAPARPRSRGLLGLLRTLARRRGGAEDGLSRAANGRILSVQDTGVTVSNAVGVSLPGMRRMRVTVRVEPEGAEPFTVTTAAVVPDHAAADVGGRVQVRYHPRDRDRVELRFPARVRPVG